MHLHVHSTHSLLSGTAGIRSLVARAVEYGMDSLALTDTAGLYGAIPFYQTAKKAGVKPILGAELDGAVLLARDRQGYADLCRAVTAYHLDEAFDITNHAASDHLFILAAGPALIRTLHARGVRPLVAVTHYGDRRSRGAACRLRDLAHSLELRPVAVNPVHFLEPGHARIHRVLTAIRLNTTLDNLRPEDLAPPEALFRSPAEMNALYRDWPETIENATWTADHCNLELTLGAPLFPSFSVPKDETPFSYLWKLAFQGVTARYKPLTRAIIRRLERELDVMDHLGFAPYFLIVWDIVQYARAHAIPIVGRGSAANSLVAYALGITRADPFKYDLYFERFLNPARTDCPDIDLDICWRRRDQVIDYVYKKYGDEHVAMIATFNTFKARAAVREVAKTFGLTPEQIADIMRGLPAYHATDIRAVVERLPECRHLRLDEEPLKSIVAISEFIDGFPRHLSIHSGGVVIAPHALTNFTPLQRAAKDVLITQYDMHPIEDLGLVKMDLLGHRSLSVIDDTVHRIRENRGIRLDIETVPDPDPLTAALIRAGQTIGCFQIESPAMRALLQNTQATNTDMLIKTLSLVRPGPSGSGMKKHFIDRHLGKEPTAYLHPSLENVLGDTYGVMLYQEDILKVASVIASMDLAEGDALRRAMSKDRSPREMAKSMKRFLEKAVRNGVDQHVAQDIWECVANFAEYAYCKAHAATYGEIAYQCAYLKAHFPAEFLSSVLANRGGFYHPAVYLEEARRLGIEIRGPDVNHSRWEYTAEGEAVRVGLLEIRNLAQTTGKRLLKARETGPFHGLSDLIPRTHMPPADASALIHAGACDTFGQTRPALLWELSAITAKPYPKTQSRNQLFLEPASSHAALHIPDYSRKNRANQQWDALGFLAATHPIEYYLPALGRRLHILSPDMPAYAGHFVTMVGWLIAERRVGLKGRGCMKFLTFEDLAGVFETVLFPEAYQRCGHLLDSHGPYVIAGNVQKEDGYCALIAERIQRAGRAPKSPRTSEITPPMHWMFKQLRPDLPAP